MITERPSSKTLSRIRTARDGLNIILPKLRKALKKSGGMVIDMSDPEIYADIKDSKLEFRPECKTPGCAAGWLAIALKVEPELRTEAFKSHELGIRKFNSLTGDFLDNRSVVNLIWPTARRHFPFGGTGFAWGKSYTLFPPSIIVKTLTEVRDRATRILRKYS